MIEQWLLNVNSCEQWLLTTVVDRVQHNIIEQCAAQHCNKLLTTLIKLFIFARVIIFYFSRHGNELYVMQQNVFVIKFITIFVFLF